MAKKQKRQYSRGGNGNTVETTASQASVQAYQRGASASEFNPDYTDVIADLKKIGILAGVFIAVLVALSFFL